MYSSTNQSVPNPSRLIKTIDDRVWGAWMPGGAVKCKAGMLEASLFQKFYLSLQPRLNRAAPREIRLLLLSMSAVPSRSQTAPRSSPSSFDPYKRCPPFTECLKSPAKLHPKSQTATTVPQHGIGVTILDTLHN